MSRSTAEKLRAAQTATARIEREVSAAESFLEVAAEVAEAAEDVRDVIIEAEKKARRWFPRIVLAILALTLVFVVVKRLKKKRDAGETPAPDLDPRISTVG
jgi:hypothetical protein